MPIIVKGHRTLSKDRPNRLLMDLPCEVLAIIASFLCFRSLLDLRRWCIKANRDVFLACRDLVDRVTLKTDLYKQALPISRIESLPLFVRHVKLAFVFKSNVNTVRTLLFRMETSLSSLAIECGGLGHTSLSIFRPFLANLAHSFCSLTRLVLKSLSLSAADAEALGVRASRFTSLQVLDLSCNYLGPKSAVFIANASRLSSLTHLDLSVNRIQDRGAIAVANSAVLTNLTFLNLAANEIGRAGIAALAHSAIFSALVHLDLGANRIADGDVACLSQASQDGGPLASVTHLRLDFCCFYESGVAALLTPLSFPNLLHLNLSGIRDMGADAAELLAACGKCSQLTRLDFRRNDMGNRGLVALAKSPHFGSLQHLDLSEIGIVTCFGCRVFFECGTFPSLTYLNLSDNHIDIAVLASTQRFTQLKELVLMSCGITSNDIRRLAQSPNFPALRLLRLLGNDLNKADIDTFASCCRVIFGWCRCDLSANS